MSVLCSFGDALNSFSLRLFKELVLEDNEECRLRAEKQGDDSKNLSSKLLSSNLLFSPFAVGLSLAAAQRGVSLNTQNYEEFLNILCCSEQEQTEQLNLIKRCFKNSNSKSLSRLICLKLWIDYPVSDEFKNFLHNSLQTETHPSINSVQKLNEQAKFSLNKLENQLVEMEKVEEFLNFTYLLSEEEFFKSSNLNKSSQEQIVFSSCVGFTEELNVKSDAKPRKILKKFYLSNTSYTQTQFIEYYRSDWKINSNSIFQSVSIPFKDSNVSCTFLMPVKRDLDESSLLEIIEKLSDPCSNSEETSLDENNSNTENNQIRYKLKSGQLRVPEKMIWKCGYRLNRPLYQIGLRSAFEMSSDFERMIAGEQEQVEIDAITHQILFEIKAPFENSSNVPFNKSGDDLCMNLNRPFIVIVRHRESRSILFIGQYSHPLNISSITHKAEASDKAQIAKDKASKSFDENKYDSNLRNQHSDTYVNSDSRSFSSRSSVLSSQSRSRSQSRSLSRSSRSHSPYSLDKTGEKQDLSSKEQFQMTHTTKIPTLSYTEDIYANQSSLPVTRVSENNNVNIQNATVQQQQQQIQPLTNNGFTGQVCFTFRGTGFCKFGQYCRFAHIKNTDLNSINNNILAPGERVCFTFRDTGFCRFREACKYKHIQSSNQQAMQQTQLQNNLLQFQQQQSSQENIKQTEMNLFDLVDRKTIACAAWSQSGGCTQGNACNYRHIGTQNI